MAVTHSSLSSRLQTRLSSLLGRIRGFRLLRGLAMTTILLTILAGGAFALDATLTLAEPVRQILLIGWLTLAVLGILATLLHLRPVPDVRDLAALVELRYPELAERLSTSIELDGNDTVDPLLLERLVRETEATTTRLPLAPALPARRTGLVTAVALLLCLGVSVPALIFPAYAETTRRFFWPFTPTAADLGYELQAGTGDQAVRRGSEVMIWATLRPLRDGVELPEGVQLVAEDGSTTALLAAGDGVFTSTRVVKNDFRYHLQAGAARTPTFTLRTLQPAQLAPDQPVTTLTPPLYASGVRDVDTLTGVVDLEAMQHGTLHMAVQFNRPVEKADFQIAPREGEPISHALAIGPDGTTGEVTLVLSQGGTYQILATTREGLTEPIPGAILTVTRDRAPEVLERERRLPGLNRPVLLSVYDVLNLGFQADDDIAVAGAWVEYALGDEKPQSHPVELSRLGRTVVQGRATIKPAADALKTAGKLRYRLRVEDNKPKELGGPNVTFFPRDRWLEVDISKDQPNRGAEILAQRDSINLKLNQLIDEVSREWRATNKIRQETRDQPKLEANQREQVREVEQNIRETAKEINKLIEENQDQRGLEPLVQALEEIRQQEIDAAQQALKQAATPERANPPRDADLSRADQKLDAARRKLEDLRQKSNDLAQQRLDQARAEQLAREQEQLAEQARELAAKEPQTPPTREQLAELERKQQELAKELEKLAENSPALKEALKQLQPEMAKELGQRAEDLAREQRELARLQEESERKPLVERLQDLARKQEELARKQEDLGQKTRPQAETAGKPLDPREARQAAESLKQGDAQQASERQDKAAGELDQLAKNLERAGDLAKDPKQATEQLAKMQADLKQEVARNPARRAEQATQQKSLEEATRRLPIEKNDLVGQARRDAAAERMEEARKELEKGNTPRAQEIMEMARNYLDQLAKTQPSKEQRDAAVRAEVDRLKTQQDQVGQLARQADQAKTPQEREQKLAEAAKKQAETAEAISKMKVPEQADRLDRSREAANQALRDLLDREKGKIAGSQEEAKRQLDRLAQALRGEKPLDERVRDLAKEQRDLAREAEALAKKNEPQKDEVERLKKKQRDLAKKADELQTPEGQKELEQARRALNQAGQGETPQDLARQAQQAAEDVDRLLRRVEHEEKPAEQAKRLADEAQVQPPGQLARELEQMRTPNEAQPENDRARQELKKAEDARTPAEREAARKQAEQALRDLAKKLEQNPEKPQPQAPPEKSPRQQAEELAKQQRDIEKGAKDAQQEQTAKGAANKQNFERKMQDLAKKQQDLNRQASQLPADGQQKSLEETRQAMNKAQGSLEKKESGAAQQAGSAAQQLEKLARSLQDRPQPQQQAQREPQPQPGQQARDQAEQARQLAQEQRDLRDQVRKTLEQDRQARQEDQQKQQPELARQQEELAKQAQELTKQAGRDRADPHAAEKAEKAAREAAEQMQRGETGQAEKSAQQAIEQFKKIADQMKQAGNGEGQKQAEELARRQEQMQQKLQQSPQGQQARQEQLQQKGQDLMQQLQKLAEQMKNQPGEPTTQEAAKAGQEAQQAMQRAQEQARQGNAGQAQQARQEAAQKLEQAGKQAQQAAREGMANRPMPMQPGGQPGAEGTGESLQEARRQSQQAQQQLQKQEPGAARERMQQAAEAIQKLAQQMLPQSGQQPMKTAGQVPEFGPMPGGLPNAEALPPELAPYAGKNWSELPGELRTRILQEARGRYGDDYARTIKLYFEQLATQGRKDR